MQLITEEIKRQLIANWHEVKLVDKTKPPLKLFAPWGSATWLISELDPEGDNMFGLCDLGFGTPELGYVSLNELTNIVGPMGLTIERDINFEPEKSLMDYAQDAKEQGAITA